MVLAMPALLAMLLLLTAPRSARARCVCPQQPTCALADLVPADVASGRPLLLLIHVPFPDH